jgi:DNA-binding MarR family transcriptional regulator
MTQEPPAMNDVSKDIARGASIGTDQDGLDLSNLHDTTGFLVRIVQLQLFQAFFDVFSARGLTTGSYTALVAIRDNPGVKQGDLADCMLIKRSNMTKLISGLEAQGLVERRASSVDKRAVDLYLTPGGESLLAGVFEEVRQHDREVTRALSPPERERLLNYLTRISADLRMRRQFET